MPAARYLDTFTPAIRQAEPRTSPQAHLTGLTVGGGFGAGAPDMRIMAEQARHFRYWNFVAISRIADRCAGQYPMLGTVVRGTGGAPQRLRPEQYRWIRQAYSGRILQAFDDDVEIVPTNHPLCELMNRINPSDTWGQFIWETVLFRRLCGKVYWWAIPNGFGLPAELWAVAPHWVEPVYAKSGELLHYWIRPEGNTHGQFQVPPEELHLLTTKSPLSKLEGWSALRAAPLWSDNVEEMERSRAASLKNGINPTAIIELDKDKYANPADDVITSIKAKFLARAGGTHRAGEPLIQPPGTTIKPWGNKPIDMDFPTGGEQTRDNALALHGVPKPIAGITTDVNRATVEGANVIFCEVTINPELRYIASAVEERIARQFGDNLRAWFEDATPRDALHELEEAKADFAMGALTPDERRRDRGREPLDEPAYTSGYIPAGLMPLSAEAIEELTPEPPPPTETIPADDETIDEDDETPPGDDETDDDTDEE